MNQQNTKSYITFTRKMPPNNVVSYGYYCPT